MLESFDLAPELHRLATQAETYVNEVLGVDFGLTPVADCDRLPFFLTDRYRFLQAMVFATPCIFMAVQARDLETPAAIARHWSQARLALGGGIVAILTDALSVHDRRRLIARRIPFIVPGNQLFMPDLAVDLRENFRVPSKSVGDRLTPAAQVLVLATILGQTFDGLSASRLARRFDYSPMSIGRVFDELETFELAQIRDVGRERLIDFAGRGRRLWDQARDLLQSPVRTSRLIVRPPTTIIAPIAGETALAHYTNLSDPRRQTRAVAAKDWKALSQHFEFARHNRVDEDGLKIESWSYDPALLSQDPAVDRLSLYLSLEDRRDERIDQAAEALLEDMAW